ncbi:MAG: hypothetical protein ACU0B7_03435 [Paracoccaceae bacterium]
MANPFNESDPVRKTYFINESERSVDPADDVGKVVQLEADGKIDGSFLRASKIEKFTSSGTWTKDEGLQYIIVEVQAAGGNGATGVDNGSTGSPGGGGGGGGYTKKLIPASALGASETVTVGGVGSNSSFGLHCSATPGANASGRTGGAGGQGFDGDINLGGSDGSPGERPSAVVTLGGRGGSAFMGGGGREGEGTAPAGNASPGKDYGGGGGGGGASDSGTMGAGGAGAPAIVIVTEYY